MRPYCDLMRVIEKAFAELSGYELYDILKLRVDVFVVEQDCPYPELDDRDREPETRHLWIPGESTPIAAYLRVLLGVDGVWIGRVVAHPSVRGTGAASHLLRHAIDAHPGERFDIHAQAHLAGWYATFGFEGVGEEFLEDGIPHLAMVRRGAS